MSHSISINVILVPNRRNKQYNILSFKNLYARRVINMGRIAKQFRLNAASKLELRPSFRTVVTKSGLCSEPKWYSFAPR